MVKKSKKSKSKRMPLRKKYKIIKKVKEHHKKLAKEANKTGKKKTPVEKDPGIPNAWPFKEQELAKLEARRQKALEEIEAKKQEKKERQAKRRAGLLDKDEDEDALNESAAMAELAHRAKQRETEFDKRKKQKVSDRTGADLNDGSRRAFYREFQKVVEASDVVIQVLDARDPLGCRCTEVERLVLKSGAHKRVILLLNKIDLVPKEIAEKWLKYLREELPTVAFKCSTQTQKSNLGQKSGNASDALQSSQCLGAETLLQLLKNYSRNQKLKTAITVGVVGFPNVGKSSLINSLKRTRVASVGSTPGVTRALQEVHLDKQVKLLDSPGIVFAAAKDGESAAALRNAVKVEQITDPISPVSQIVRLCDTESLMAIYKISRFSTVEEFIRSVAFARGKLKKGGVPDIMAAAKTILRDWNEGKIPYFTQPPERTENREHAEAAIVSDWGKEFDVEAVFKDEATAVIAGLPELSSGSYTELPPSSVPTMDLDSIEESDEEGESEEEEGGSDMATEAAIRMEEDEGAKPVQRGREFLSQTEKLYDADGILNTKLAKADRKRKKKASKAAGAALLVTKAVGGGDEEDDNDDYDFRTDFGAMDGVEEDGEDDGIGEEEDVSGDEEGDFIEAE